MKVVFRGLSNGNNFEELGIPQIVFIGLPHRKLIRGACHTENGFKNFPHEKLFRRVCHAENRFEEVATERFKLLKVCQT